MDFFNMTQCNISQAVGDSNRFFFHVLLVHISTCILEKDTQIFTEKLIRSLLVTGMAIILYHVFVRKLIEPKIEKMKLICINGAEKRKKKLEIEKTDPLISNLRYKINEARNKKKRNQRNMSPRDYSKRQQNLYYRKK